MQDSPPYALVQWDGCGGVSGVLVGHSGGPGEGVGMPVFRQPVTCALDSTETQPHGIEKRHR